MTLKKNKTDFSFVCAQMKATSKSNTQRSEEGSGVPGAGILGAPTLQASFIGFGLQLSYHSFSLQGPQADNSLPCLSL